MSVALALGFDSLTALGMLFCSVAAGYGAGCTQPFSVGVAQGIAGVPIFSGLPYRMGIFVLLLVLNISYVMYHARKVKKDPKSSPVYEIDLLKRDKIDLSTAEKLSTRQAICLGLLGLNFVCIIVGVLKFDFYMNEISAIFLIMGILSGIICRLHPNDICDAFLEGCKGMMLPCLAVAMCKAATILLDNAKVMDTIIYYLAGMLDIFPSSIIAFGMFIIQDCFNLLVPSSSGQAAISMPIMAPLADIVGLTRQTAVLRLHLRRCLHELYHSGLRRHHVLPRHGKRPLQKMGALHPPSHRHVVDRRLLLPHLRDRHSPGTGVSGW